MFGQVLVRLEFFINGIERPIFKTHQVGSIFSFSHVIHSSKRGAVAKSKPNQLSVLLAGIHLRAQRNRGPGDRNHWEGLVIHHIRYIFAIDDAIRQTPDRSSARVGRAQGVLVASVWHRPWMGLM